MYVWAYFQLRLYLHVISAKRVQSVNKGPAHVTSVLQIRHT
jgi:hypothetical protein